MHLGLPLASILSVNLLVPKGTNLQQLGIASHYSTEERGNLWALEVSINRCVVFGQRRGELLCFGRKHPLAVYVLTRAAIAVISYGI